MGPGCGSDPDTVWARLRGGAMRSDRKRDEQWAVEQLLAHLAEKGRRWSEDESITDKLRAILRTVGTAR